MIKLLVLITLPCLVFSQNSTSSPVECPGGSVVYQDVAVVYDLSFYPGDSLDLSKQIGNAISSQLFSSPQYQLYDDAGARATQITTVPFPNTVKYNLPGYIYNYGLIESQADLVQKVNNQVNFASAAYTQHPATSKISDALNYMLLYLQSGRRTAPVGNTIIIIAKRDSDVTASQSPVASLKSGGSKIVTIGVGTDSVSGLSSLSSGEGYSFTIDDITNADEFNNIAQSIVNILATDCGTTWYGTTGTGPTTAPTSTSTTVATTTTTPSPTTSSTSTIVTTSVSSTEAVTSPTSTTSTSTTTSSTSTVVTTTLSTTVPTTTGVTTQPSTSTTPPVTTPTTRVTTPTTTAPTTTPGNPCQASGTFVNLDLALVYDVSISSSDPSDTQLPTFITSTLFSPSAYNFDYFHPIPVPFPRTQTFADANSIPTRFTAMSTLPSFVRAVTVQKNLALMIDSTQSIVNDGLTYLISSPLQRRDTVTPEVIMIMAKNANNITQDTVASAQTLKDNGFTVVTLGIGNYDFTYLNSLASSNDFAFIIYDITNADSVQNTVNNIATKLVNLCATNPAGF